MTVSLFWYGLIGLVVATTTFIRCSPEAVDALPGRTRLGQIGFAFEAFFIWPFVLAWMIADWDEAIITNIRKDRE